MRCASRGVPVLLAVALALASGGCAELRRTLGMDTPSAQVAGAALKDIGLEAATLVFDVEVTNPLAVPLPLTTW